MSAEVRQLPGEPEKIVAIDAEYLSGKRFPYQEDVSLVEDVDLLAATPGEDINWLEDVTLLAEEGVPAVFDRYSNSFIKIYFDDPGRARGRDRPQGADQAPAVGQLVRDPLKERHCKFAQPELGPWVAGSRDGRHRLQAAGARGLGAAGALSADAAG